MDWVNQHASAVYTAASLAILAAMYFALKFKVDLWWTNFWYSVWKRRKLAGDITRSDKNPGWTNSELALCRDYNKFIRVTKESEFAKRIEYLSRARDLGRHPMPAWMLILISVLVVAEGLGFSYMLGTWMAMEGSADTHRLLMWAIVFVLATILVFVMHFAGHQLFHTNRIMECKRDWRADGQPDRLRSEQMKLQDDQAKDDRQAPYTQCLNRVDGDGSYFGLGVAIVAIVVIATTSTWMRYEHLQKILTEDTAPAISQTSQDNGNPFATTSSAAPTGGNELISNQKAANSTALSDKNHSEKDEGMAAFLMLAFIFIVTQFVGITAGYRWGFAGKESKEAYRGTGGFSTYDDYMAHFSPVIQAAESQLHHLQQELGARDTNRKITTSKTFEDYLAEGAVRAPSTPRPASVLTGTSESTDDVETYDAYSDKARNRVTRKMTLADLEALVSKGEIDDNCFVLKGVKWIKLGDIRLPELPVDSMPPLPD